MNDDNLNKTVSKMNTNFGFNKNLNNKHGNESQDKNHKINFKEIRIKTQNSSELKQTN